MPTSPERELEDFLASKPAWMQRVLKEDFSSFSPAEMLAWIDQQDELFELRQEFQRILRKMPARWNQYCKTVRKNFAVEQQYGAGMIVPKAVRGAPNKHDRAAEAAKLHQEGRTFPQIADLQAAKHGEHVSSDAIRKQVARLRARTEFKS